MEIILPLWAKGTLKAYQLVKIRSSLTKFKRQTKLTYKKWGKGEGKWFFKCNNPTWKHSLQFLLSSKHVGECFWKLNYRKRKLGNAGPATALNRKEGPRPNMGLLELCEQEFGAPRPSGRGWQGERPPPLPDTGESLCRFKWQGAESGVRWAGDSGWRLCCAQPRPGLGGILEVTV